MNIPVLIESVPGSGFRVRGGEPFPIVAEGATREAALAQFRESVSAKLQEGVTIASIEIQANEHPWISFAGMFTADDPLVEQWSTIVSDERSSSEGS